MTDVISTVINATPLRIDTKGDGRAELYHLRFNHKAWRLFEHQTGRRCYLDFLSDSEATSKISATDLATLIWVGLHGYGKDNVPPIEEVASWITIANSAQFSAVVEEALNEASKGPESKVPAKKK